MPHAYNKHLIDDDGNTIASFKTHWQAVAALLRLSNPEFRSLSGDSPEALATERVMRERMKTVNPADRTR